MHKIEIGHTFRRIIRMFYQLGVWRNEREEPELRKSCMRPLYLLQYATLLIFVVTNAYLSDDKSQRLYLVAIAICASVVLLKLWFLLYRKNDILQFLYDPTVTHCIAHDDDVTEVTQKINKILKFIRGYALVTLFDSLILVFLPLPLFSSVTKVPFFIRFNVESGFDWILYWLLYVIASVGCVATVTYNLTNVFVWYIMYNYSIAYNLLGNQLRRLGYATEHTSRNSFHRDLIGLIQAQNKLFDTVQRFRSCFSTLFLYQIFTGAITICGSTYNLAFNTTGNFFEISTYAVLLLYAFSDIFLIMYLANEITQESNRLSYCLFESNWTDQPEATKKCIVILSEMIRRPQQLVIFMYPMNLEKFLSIANGAYSMFSLLKRIQ